MDALENQIKYLAKKEDIEKLTGSIKEVRDEVDNTTLLVHEIEKRLKDWKRILDYLSEKIKGGITTTTGGGGGEAGVSQEYVDDRLKKLRDEILSLL